MQYILCMQEAAEPVVDTAAPTNSYGNTSHLRPEMLNPETCHFWVMIQWARLAHNMVPRRVFVAPQALPPKPTPNFFFPVHLLSPNTHSKGCKLTETQI